MIQARIITALIVAFSKLAREDNEDVVAYLPTAGGQERGSNMLLSCHELCLVKNL